MKLLFLIMNQIKIKKINKYKMNLTTIIPIHEYSEEIEKLFNKAIDSVKIQKKFDEKPLIIVVYTAELGNNELFKKRMSSIDDDIEIKYLENDGKGDFQSQINFGVKNTTTDWFSILEFDDEISTTYLYNVDKTISKMENVDVILPILVEVNEKNEGLKLTNQIVWSKQFVGENGTMGFLNTNSLNQYTDFKISGGVFKKSTFIDAGGLKSNIKLTFTYEFLLRLLNNGAIIYNLPKIGLKHFATREGSLFDVYNKTLSQEERKFWFNTAKSESNFYNDRDIDQSLLLKKVK